MIETARALLDQRGVDSGGASHLAEILDALPGRGFAPGEALCSEGDEGGEMWVLVRAASR